MTKKVYTDLIERIWERVPNLKWADLWNNQIENEGKEYPFDLPAVFLHFKEGRDNELQQGLLEVTGTLTVLIVSENYEDHYQSTAQTVNQSALAFFDFKDVVTKALQGFTTNEIRSLQRKAQRTDASFTNLYVYEIDFDIQFYDLAAVRNDWELRNPIFTYTKDFVENV